MISINLTDDKELIDSVLNIPEVYQMVNGTWESKPIDKSYREELTERGFKFLAIVKDSLTVGLFSFRTVTYTCQEAHIHILPEHHKKGFGKRAVTAGIEWFKNNHTRKIITYVPSNCFHVLKFMKENEFNVCGQIADSVIYNNELVNLYIFERGL